MTYVAVLWIEVSPSFLESWRKGPAGFQKTLGENFLPVVEKALPFVIALGLLLPTMHQSSLGTLMLLSGKKLHALWSTPLLPLLFLISCLAMGYAVVIFESTLSARRLQAPPRGQDARGPRQGRRPVPVGVGRHPARRRRAARQARVLRQPDGYVLLFLVEMALIVVPAVMLASPERRADAGASFRAAILMILAGTLYRIDTFIVAFRPGAQYAYFPSLAEIIATVGIVAIEIIAYVFIVKRFPDSDGSGSGPRGRRVPGEVTHDQRIVVDPITRIEGHLRIDVEVDGGKVTNAWSSGQMFRGIETILKGRDPREAWLFTQRFCGVCTTVHAIASVRTVENALGLEIPLNAQYIRNLIVIAHALHDHIVHFYHLSALDWVDVVSALKADPAKTSALAESLSTWPNNSTKKLAAVQDEAQGLRRGGAARHLRRTATGATRR